MSRVLLGHGSGGELTHRLIRDVFKQHLTNAYLDALDDAALLPIASGRVAMTTDGFVVSPLTFAGGDIGSLAVNGTVNDLAVGGAQPRFLTLGAIIEEGLPLDALERYVASAARAAREAEVSVVAGDTKVVERGKGDGLFLTTAGIGEVRPGYPRGDRGCAPGDAIVVSGPIGDHGAVILAARSGVELALASDCGPVHRLVDALFDAGAPLFMRDPTRGGVAGVLVDLAEQAGCGVSVREVDLPVNRATASLCDLTGVDPLQLACEGRVVAVVEADGVDDVLASWRALPEGRGAARIGTLTEARPGRVVLQTPFGGARTVMRPTAEVLPRIC